MNSKATRVDTVLARRHNLVARTISKESDDGRATLN
jgi:hypothetical protein